MKRPEDIQFREKEIYILWDDLTSISISPFELRCACPCAYCVDEVTGEIILKRNEIDVEVKPLEAHLVGAYAMQIKWSDHHSTGIYTWDFLERMGKQLSVRTDAIAP